MSRFTPRIIAAAATLALTCAASAQSSEFLHADSSSITEPRASVGLTREQVKAELATARRDGTVGEGGEIGDSPQVLMARAAANEAQAQAIVARLEEDAARQLAEPSAPLAAVNGQTAIHHVGGGPGVTQSTQSTDVPDSRVIAIDAPTLFVADTGQLSEEGVRRLRNYAEAMQDARVEVIVISLPLAPDTPPVQANLAADRRARAIKEILSQNGIAHDRIYTEVRPLSSMAVGMSQPVVIETVAAFS